MGCEFSIPDTPANKRLRQDKRIYDLSQQQNQPIFEKVNKIQSYQSQADHQLLSNTLSKHFLLFRLTEAQKNRLIPLFDLYICKKGQQVFSKGSPAALFFIIRSGQVSIEKQKDSEKILLGKGDYFGDLALLYSAPRSASVKGESECEFFCIEHKAFRKVIQEIVKDNYNVAKSYIDKISLFKFLSKKQKNSLAYNAHCIRFQQGQNIFTQGDDANAFYILTSGKVALKISGTLICEMKEGESFGQNCFKINQKRSGTCTALQKTSLLSISRETLKKCLGNQLQQISFYNIMKWGLKREKTFEKLTSIEREKLLSQCELKIYEDKEKICGQSEKAQFILICLQGKINDFDVGSILNAEYLIVENENQLKMTKNIVKNGKGFVGRIFFNRIFKLLGKNILSKNIATQKQLLQTSHRHTSYLSELQLKDFRIISKLGSGHFGLVYLVQDKYERLYAMKCLQKEKYKEDSMKKKIVAEKDIMEMVENPFIMKMYRTFQDHHYLYFLLKYIDGFDFYEFLRHVGTCDRKQTQFYSACLILALEHLHTNNIVYRDLKPENTVLDQKGFLHLIDLGSAKVLGEENGHRTFTVTGTPHYMAPEILQLNGYSYEVDLWSLGVMVFEMFCGYLPFGNDETDPYEIFKCVETKELVFPITYTDITGKQLVSTLLSRSRYGEDWAKVKNMVFFSEVNWNGMMRKNIATPVKLKQRKNKNGINEPLVSYMEKGKSNVQDFSLADF